MKNLNLDFIDNEKLNDLYEIYSNDDYEYNANKFNEEIDHPKGWSYVYLGEVINYYINQS